MLNLIDQLKKANIITGKKGAHLMATITKKKMYADLMRMDGARMRDLNPKSKADLALATAGPVLKTGAKVVGIAVGVAAVGLGAGTMLTSCDDNSKTPDPKCDCTNNVHNGACPAPCPGKGINPPCDCRDPNPCLCPDQANHLANGESKSCTGEPCKHTCAEQTATIGAIPVTKNVGITVAQMDAAVDIIDELYTTIFDNGERTAFNTKVKAIVITSGGTVILNGTTLSVGCNATIDDMVLYAYTNLVAQLQHQPKTEWLASNKGRGWVAKLMNDRIASVNDFRNIAHDKARGISI